MILRPNVTGSERIYKETEDVESCQHLCASLNAKHFSWDSRCFCKTALDKTKRKDCSKSTCVFGEAYCENDEREVQWRNEEREHVVGFEWLAR